MKRDVRHIAGAEHGGGVGIRSDADSVFQFGKVTSSSIGSTTGALLYDISGIADMSIDLEAGTTETALGDGEGEVTSGTDVFHGIGIVGRPLPPDVRNGRAEHLEVVCIRQQDGLLPIAARDVRLRMGGQAPGEGVLAFTGYGGGFHSLTPVAVGNLPDAGGTIHVLYCPYDFDANGVAQKAHTIIMDPTPGNESVIIAHAEGHAITMSDDDMVLKSQTGASSITINDDQILFVAPQVVFNAGVIIGEPLLAVPLLAGAASPPCSKLFVSP